jgi:hypothetical protein
MIPSADKLNYLLKYFMLCHAYKSFGSQIMKALNSVVYPETYMA